MTYGPKESMYDTRDWMTKEVLRMGQNQFAYFNALYKSQPSCKDLMQKSGDDYENCMVEKVNCAYEETIRLFNKIDLMKKQVGLEDKVVE